MTAKLHYPKTYGGIPGDAIADHDAIDLVMCPTGEGWGVWYDNHSSAGFVVFDVSKAEAHAAASEIVFRRNCEMTVTNTPHGWDQDRFHAEVKLIRADRERAKVKRCSCPQPMKGVADEF